MLPEIEKIIIEAASSVVLNVKKGNIPFKVSQIDNKQQYAFWKDYQNNELDEEMLDVFESKILELQEDSELDIDTSVQVEDIDSNTLGVFVDYEDYEEELDEDDEVYEDEDEEIWEDEDDEITDVDFEEDSILTDGINSRKPEL